MSSLMWGVVKDGLIVPQATLPEGTRVQIVVNDAIALPPELQSELDAWSLGSTEALAAFEEALDQDASHAQG